MSDALTTRAGGDGYIERDPELAIDHDPRKDDDGAPAIPAVFRQLLVNTLITGVTSTFLWFALTFWCTSRRARWLRQA
jgi:hypothetical protein